MRPFGLENFIKLSLKGVGSYVVDRICLGYDRNKWRAPVNKVMNFCGIKCEEFLVQLWKLQRLKNTYVPRIQMKYFFKIMHMYSIHSFNIEFTCIYQKLLLTNMISYMKINSYVEGTSSSKGRRIRGIRGGRCRKKVLMSIYVRWCNDLFTYLWQIR